MKAPHQLPASTHLSSSNPPLLMVPTPADLSPHHHHISPLLIATAVLLAAAFLLAVSYFIYSATPQRQQHHPEFDQSVDVLNRHHPGLYITTAGLDPSVIESIATCEHKTGDNPVHGTACAVCLAEFEDGESLRLLPTGCHAFHPLCIDTWLASHTTCPICRAPVLPAAVGLPGHTVEVIHGLGSTSS